MRTGDSSADFLSDTEWEYLISSYLNDEISAIEATRIVYPYLSKKRKDSSYTPRAKSKILERIKQMHLEGKFIFRD